MYMGLSGGRALGPIMNGGVEAVDVDVVVIVVVDTVSCSPWVTLLGAELLGIFNDFETSKFDF